MVQTPEFHGASLMLVRRILDQFCTEHDLAISDARAVAAARFLMDLTLSEKDESAEMHRRVEDWFNHTRMNA
ncbi:hypothetical protein DXT91_10080 [Agrobacterium tumefaciens]|uniref:hypothetical protein n=1 Tax=Agrobacterium tumefaciens TaxID=358 RepID=UPI0012B84C77|nr:hypothetical protein [Agrobacterium tumefaciens]MQB04479.1 hypothetical protein [Agrobacterium tumefaciens]